MKKTLIWILMVLAVFGLVSCNKKADSAEKVTVRILTRYSNPDNVREKYFIDQVKKFSEANPDIILEDVSISDENARDTRFKTAVAANDPIEVFNFLGYAANLDYVKNGVVTDLSTEIKNDPQWTASYNQGLFGPAVYDSFDISGVYGIPTAPYGVCTFYNKSIFDSLNLPLPESWEDIEAIAPVLISNGKIPMAFGAMDNYRGGHFLTALAMKYYGSDLKDALISGTEKWNGVKTIDLIKMMQKWYEAGIFGSNNMAYGADGELARLESGEAAIIFSGSWNIGTISTFANAKDLVCKGFPSFNSKPQYRDMWMSGPDDFLSISSKPGDAKYEATVKVLKHFTSYEYWQGLYEIQKGAGTYPVNFQTVIEADHISNGFNEYYRRAAGTIGEIEQYDTMASLMDIVRTELQALFAGDNALSIGDRIQREVDAYRR